MRYQVPQFVDIKDRIIGPLTLKQFLYYMAAGIFLIPVYMLSDLGLFLTVAIPVLGVAAAFAHISWQGQTFVSLLTNGLKYLTGERMYLWRREAEARDIHVTGSEYEGLTEEEMMTDSALDAVAQTLNARGNVIAQDETDPLLELEEEEAK
jgi:hypothetical protein